MTSTAPTPPGDVAVIDVVEFTATCLAATVPKDTVEPPVNALPVMVTVVPPAGVLPWG